MKLPLSDTPGCPVPAVVTAASGKLFRKGFLIKDGTALERLAEVDTVVFDKTGTLTLGEPEAQDIAAHPRPELEIVAALAACDALRPTGLSDQITMVARE